MKVFHCNHCRQLVFFENNQCVGCERPLAYFADLGTVGSLDGAGENLWRSPLPGAKGHTYRLCENYRKENVCNWAIPSADSNPLCPSCRLTRVIPDLSQQEHKKAWYRLEIAKRRLIYSLLALQLPLRNKFDDPDHGLAFEFLSDPATSESPAVLTGHADGVITINIAEADDAQREHRRLQMHEPYRTLLGHFRHEIGHYYWDRLIKESRWLGPFREIFGDEQRDYEQSLREHYENGPAADWQKQFVSAYAGSHPWEDWAETWAHYLHMTDTLETAEACGLMLCPLRPGEPALPTPPKTGPAASFERLLEGWFPLTYVLNNLNRSMGQPDGYPFVLSTPVIDKLRFVHETIHGCIGHENAAPK